MLRSLFFFEKGNVKIRKIDANSYYWRRKSWNVLNELRNLNEIFRETATDHNIKKPQKTRSPPFLLKTDFWKSHCRRGSNWPLPPALLGLHFQEIPGYKWKKTKKIILMKSKIKPKNKMKYGFRASKKT